MQQEFLRQCLLVRGTSTFVAWLPEKYAKQGETVDLKHNGEWDKDWYIADVYSSMPAFEVREHQRINLPSISV